MTLVDGESLKEINYLGIMFVTMHQFMNSCATAIGITIQYTAIKTLTLPIKFRDFKLCRTIDFNLSSSYSMLGLETAW